MQSESNLLTSNSYNSCAARTVCAKHGSKIGDPDVPNDSKDAEKFDYGTAFSRNIGWITETEQQVLRQSRVAIAGLGGVGGAHLAGLSRLGIGAFNISDPDIFEVINFNRQLGATMSQIGQPKVDVIAKMALDVNPEVDLNLFPKGIGEHNVNEFLRDVDLYLDGLDFFVMNARETVFAACAEKGIPALTAAPLGWGTALIVFVPGGMSFEDYFQMAGQPHEEKLMRFLAGLSPTGMELEHIVDPTRLNIPEERGPSTPIGAFLSAAVACTSVVKLLLRRGEVLAAPWSLHFDAFTGRSEWVERPGGMSHPEMQARLAAMRKA